MPVDSEPSGRRRIGLLVLVWALAVPVAAALGVLALRSAGADSSTTVLSAAQAAALTTASPAAPRPSPTASLSPPASSVDPMARRVPGAVLGLRCEMTTPVLVWSVPDPGWRIEQVEREDGGLRVRLEADDDEVRVTIVCANGTPQVVEAERSED